MGIIIPRPKPLNIMSLSHTLIFMNHGCCGGMDAKQTVHAVQTASKNATASATVSKEACCSQKTVTQTVTQDPAGARSRYHDGYEDGFEPLTSLDLSKCNDFDELVKAMSNTAFGGRTLGEAADVLYAMVTDPDCFVVMSLAGAMTPAKMGLLICDMIDLGIVHAVVSTGALMTHGFVEAKGMTHFKYKFGQMDDVELYDKGYDRIYDVLELEQNLDDTELIFRSIMATFDYKEPLSSYKLLNRCGKWLMDNTKGRGVLKSAFQKNVPVYVPAFTDSEMGLDFGTMNHRRKKNNLPPYTYNPFLDLDHFADLIKKQKTIGIFTIGGGVPRNWSQQVAPYLDIVLKRVENQCQACDGDGCDTCEGRGFIYSDKGKAVNRYKYGVRICPEPVHWGGLSGCTYSEGVTWGKFVPQNEGGMWSEVLIDATVAWPLLLKAVLQRLQKNGKLPIKKNFNVKDILNLN